MNDFCISLKVFAIYNIWFFNSGKIDMYTKGFEIHEHLNFPSLEVKNIKHGRCNEIHVCVNIVISINMISNSRLLGPNQEYQALIPIVGHLAGGIGDVQIKC